MTLPSPALVMLLLLRISLPIVGFTLVGPEWDNMASFIAFLRSGAGGCVEASVQLQVPLLFFVQFQLVTLQILRM